MKNPNDPTGHQTRDISFGAVPQPTIEYGAMVKS
jgi:hypothetical protein